jgi:DNA-binding NtrC family response regulator
VVEDDPATRMAVECWLSLNGFSVRTVANGSEAAADLDDREEVIDVAVVDIGLPDVSGVTLCEFMHEFYPFLPVVVFSGQATPEDVGRVTAAGVRHILSKPVDPDQFLSAVKDALP